LPFFLLPALLQAQSWIPVGLANTDVSGILQMKGTGYLIAASTVGVHRSTDNGKTWTLCFNITGSTAQYANWDLCTDGGDNVYGQERSNFFCRSTNSGTTWQGMNGDGITQTLSGILWYLFPTKSGSLFGTTSATLFRSDDHATTWKPVGQGLSEDYPHIIAMAEASDGSLYAGSAGIVGGNIHKSTDNGETFTQLYEGKVNKDVIALTVTSSGTVLASVYNEGIMRSTDQGEHWTTINTGLGKTVVPLGFLYRGNEIVCQLGLSVYTSNDDGQTWQIYCDLPNEENWKTKGIMVHNDGTVYAATSKGLYKFSQSTDAVKQNQSIASSLAIQPQSISDQSTITVISKDLVNASVKIYDILGIERTTLFNGMLTRGSNRFSIPKTALPSGMYTVVAESNSVRTTKRILISR